MKFKSTILIPFISIPLSLFLLFLLKSSLTGIELVDTDFFYFGNIVSIANYTILMTGLIILIFKDGGKKHLHNKIVKFLSVVVLLPLLVIFFFIQLGITFPGLYLFGFPLEKLVLSSLFMLYEFILIFLLFFVWNLIFSRGYRIYVDSMLLTIGGLGAFYIVVFLYSLGYKGNTEEQLSNVENLAFVLGAAVWQDRPSPIFEGRIEKSFQLYNKGRVSKIQVTGSNAPGELSEAKIAHNYLLQKGVKTADILIEENSSNTHQQIQFLFNNKAGYNREFTNIILVSDEFHMVRLIEMCRYYDLKVVTITSDYKLNWEKLLYYRIRESVALFLFWLFGI